MLFLKYWFTIATVWAFTTIVAREWLQKRMEGERAKFIAHCLAALALSLVVGLIYDPAGAIVALIVAGVVPLCDIYEAKKR